MPRGKSKKAFLKIKEKLVFLPSKKFLGRRVLGVVLLVAGSLILTFSLVYFYLVPVFFPPKTKVVTVKEKKPAFLAKRVLIPAFDLSLPVKDGLIEGSASLNIVKSAKGKEIFLLGEREYQVYRVIEAEVVPATAEAGLGWEEGQLRLILVSQTKPLKNIIIKAEAVEL
jgi:hypothetical protein